MSSNALSLKMAFAGIASCMTYFFGGLDKILIALITFLVVDYISGILAAIIKKELNSSTGLQGIIKKVMQLFLVGIAATLDGLIGLGEPYLRTVVIWFIISNEGISILENISRAGVPIPSFLVSALQQLSSKGEMKIE